MSESHGGPVENTDRLLLIDGDVWAASIHVVEGGGIGITVKGKTVVMPLREWHRIGLYYLKSIKRISG